MKKVGRIFCVFLPLALMLSGCMQSGSGGAGGTDTDGREAAALP